jgi:hypothetical protein
MYRASILAALAIGASTASAVNDATYNLNITSANGGADSLFSWSYSGTPTLSGQSVSIIFGWGSGFLSGSGDTVTGPTYTAYDRIGWPFVQGRGLPTITGIPIGLSLTNTTTNVTRALTQVDFEHYGEGAFMGFSVTDTGAPQSDRIYMAPGEVAILSGPNSGSFLSGIAFDNFYEGQWTTDFTPYANFDPVLTIGGSAPLPEPSTYGFAIAGLALIGAAIRRHRSRK